MGVKVTNNGFGTLSAGINSSATTVTVDSGQGARFPALSSGDFFFATLIDTSNNLEIIKVTARSTDSMTVLRAQDSTSARAFSIGDRIELRPTAALFENAHLDNTPTSTGSFGLPKGTTAQQPTASATEGHIRYDTDDDVVYFSNGTNWIKISSVIATLSSVSGSILDGVASTLTLSGTGFISGANLVVNFTQTSDSINTNVTVSASSDTSATVAVPSAVYNNVTVGNVVSLKVTNADNVVSGVLNTTAVGLPTGGTITTSGSYRIHTFTGSGNFVVPTGFTASAEALIVAGGGGGGIHSGGGGGAGGLLYYGAETPKTPNGSAIAISAQTYAVVVGGAGAASGSPYNAVAGTGGDGGNSSAFGYTAIGGGGGGSGNGSHIAGRAGGSGGGGSRSAAGGAGTSGQGNAGGSPNTGTTANYPGGGGGGAGAVGGNGSTSAGGPGGIGLQYSITGSATYYAGGGGGTLQDVGGGDQGAGGNGGGGAGRDSAQGEAGDPNTGGGGGGGHYSSGAGGGAGGSGIVIIRYIP